jgi:hypothetical protein
MPLQFPSSASIGQTYQSGSLATYVYNGEAWDVQAVGTLSVTSASFADLATTAMSSSTLIGSDATYLAVSKSSAQTIASSYTTITNWATPYTSINAGEWNGTTGVFTATKTGTYLVNGQLQMGSAAWNQNSAVGVQIFKNSTTSIGVGIAVNQVSASTFPAQCNASTVVSLVPGDTLRLTAFSGVTASIHNLGTALTIQELPTKIQR